MYISNNSNVGMATLLQQNKNIVKASATTNTSATAPTVLPNGNGSAIVVNNRVIVGGNIATTGILVNNSFIVGNNSGNSVGGIGSTGLVVGSGGILLQQSQHQQQTSMQSMTNGASGTASIITYNQYQQLLQQQQNTQIVTTTSAAANRTATTTRLLMPHEMVSIPTAVSTSGASAVSGVASDGLVMIANSAGATAPGTTTTATQGTFLVAATPIAAAATTTNTITTNSNHSRQFTQQREQSQITKMQYSNNNRTIATYIPNRIVPQHQNNLSTIGSTATKSVVAATASVISTNNNNSNSNMNTATNTNASNSIRYFAQIGQQQQQQNVVLKRTVVTNNNITTSSNNVVVLNRSIASGISGLSGNSIATTSSTTFFAQRQQQVRYTNSLTSTISASNTATITTVPNGNNVVNSNNKIGNANSALSTISKIGIDNAIDCSNHVNDTDTIEVPTDATKPTLNANVADDTEPEVDIVINNVVCSFSVRCHLNLRDIALKGSNVEYRRENGMVTMKLRRPYTTASIWSSGRITCTGATSEPQAKIAARRYARCLSKLGFPVHFQNFRIVNVLGTCSMPWAIKIVNFSERFRDNASYEPELHPGVTYKMRDPKATLKIFSTGSITVTAASVADVQSAIEHIYPLVFDFRKKRSPEELQQLRAKQKQIAHADPNELEDIFDNGSNPNGTNSNIAAEVCNSASVDKSQNTANMNIDGSIKRNATAPTLVPASTNARRKATETWASKQQNKRPCYTGGTFAAATTGSNLAIRNRLSGGVVFGGGAPGGGFGGGNLLASKSMVHMLGQKRAVNQQSKFQHEHEDEDVDDPDTYEFDPEELIEVDENAL